MNPLHEYKDPYADLPEFEKNRSFPPGQDLAHFTTVKLSGADRAYVLGIHGGRPTIQTTISILFSRFIHELKRNNIGPAYDPAAYESAVGRINISLNGAATAPATSVSGGTSPNPESHEQTPNRNDGRGVASVARIIDEPHSVATSVSSARTSTPRRKEVVRKSARSR